MEARGGARAELPLHARNHSCMRVRGERVARVTMDRLRWHRGASACAAD